MSNQIVISSGAKVRNLSGVLTGTAGVVNSLGINVPSGIPQLDGSGKILVSQLPNSVMEYKGTWNAATNTPTLVDGTGNQGDVYLCNVAGTVNFGAGPITFSVGDQVIYSGTIWQRASGATGTVTSVAVTESGDALSITGSPITTSGTINIGFAGTSGQYVNGAGGLTTFPSLTGFVPYTGATGNVNLGEFGLTSGFVGFDLTPTGTPTGVGTLSWDSAYRTLQLIDGDGDTTLQIGQEQRALVHNNTGATLTDGQVVYVTGSTGNLPTVALASNTLEASSSVTFGVVTESIAHGADGFVTISGTVNGLDTLAFNEGDALYLGSTAGTFTNVKPVAPANLVLIGYMIKKAGGNGSIFVKIQNGYELDELHDVLVTSVENNQGLFWDSATSLWKNKSIATALGYTPANAATYVPYTGATANVDLGFNTLTAYNVQAKGLIATLNGTTSTAISLKTGSTGVQIESDSISLVSSASSSKTLSMYFDIGGVSTKADLNANSLTATRTYTLPDASGTIALTSQLTGGTVTSVGLSSSTSGVTIGSSPITTSGTITLSIATASGLQQGLLSSSDWTTFSSKQAALSGTGFVKISGSTISYDNSTYLTTSAASSTYLPLSGGTLSGALTIGVAAGTGLDVASDLVIFRASTGFGSPRQITLAAGNGPTTYLEAKGYGANYITDFGIRTYNSSGTAFEVFFATSAGDVGIGNTAPAAKLDVNGTIKATGLSLTTGGSTSAVLTSSGTNVYTSLSFVNTTTGYGYDLGFGGSASIAPNSFYIYGGSSASVKFLINSSGNVGIGTSSPQSILHLESSSSNGVATRFTSTSANGRSYAIGSNFVTGTGEFSIYDYTAGAERIRITSAGNVGIGSVGSSVVRLVAQGSGTSSAAYAFIAADSGGATLLAMRNDGLMDTGTRANSPYNFGSTGRSAIIESSGALGYLVSTRESKTNIESIKSIDFINKLNPVQFNYRKKDNKKNIYTDEFYDNVTYGFIADEVEQVNKELVMYNQDGSLCGVEYNNMIAILTKAVQELKAEIDTLKNK